MNWKSLLPPVDVDYQGPKSAFYFLVFITLVETVRSLIHIFASDGGAHSITGLDIQVAGGSNLIAMFSQWGAVQLLLALFDWIVILRYRFLVPMMLAFVAMEKALRIGASRLNLFRHPGRRLATFSCLCPCWRFFVPCVSAQEDADCLGLEVAVGKLRNFC